MTSGQRFSGEKRPTPSSSVAVSGNSQRASKRALIAGGTYLGRGENGTNTIEVPVSIIGGYSDDFAKRDPWGAHKTIFSGNNKTKNYSYRPALFIDLNKVKLLGLKDWVGAQKKFKKIRGEWSKIFK